MTLSRKIIITMLVGFIVGAVIGGIFAYIRRQQEGSVVPTTQSELLSLVCVGGSTPRIRVVWPEKLSSVMGTLERSVDGGDWTPVFSGTQQPTKDGYTDIGIIAGKRYGYRVAFQSGDSPTEVSLRADEATCTNN